MSSLTAHPWKDEGYKGPVGLLGVDSDSEEDRDCPSALDHNEECDSDLIERFSCLSLDGEGHEASAGTRNDMLGYPVNIRYWTAYESDDVNRGYVAPAWVAMVRDQHAEQKGAVIEQQDQEHDASSRLGSRRGDEDAIARVGCLRFSKKCTMRLGALTLVVGGVLEEVGRRWYRAQKHLRAGVNPPRVS
ncbi:hypothetical protein JW872_03565 [Candidatus Babeliales bacterium]|nr:hypothetical protein [Candidatus Babeliales bacterium]